MTTLGLSVVTKADGGREVAAREVGTNCAAISNSTGDIDVFEGEKVLWKNCGEGWQGTATHTFLVTFKRKDLPVGKWPLESPKKPNDKTLIVLPPFGAGTDTKLHNVWVLSKQDWKYTAVVQQDSSIGALDPMIIIRNRNQIAAVALAVVAVILIAAAVQMIRRSRSR